MKNMLLAGYGVAAAISLGCLFLQKRWIEKVIGYFALLLFAMHTWMVGRNFFFAPFGNPESLVLFSWFLMGSYLWLNRKIKTPLLPIFMFSGNFLLVLTSFSTPLSIPSGPASHSPLFPIHLMGAIFGGGLFAVAALLSMLFLLQMWQLKNRKTFWILKRLPALETLEKILDHDLRFGFGLMTLGLLTGAFWAHEYFAARWQWDANQTWALATWGLYGCAIYLRGSKLFTGKVWAYFILISGILVLGSFMLANLMMARPHHFVGG